MFSKQILATRNSEEPLREVLCNSFTLLTYCADEFSKEDLMPSMRTRTNRAASARILGGLLPLLLLVATSLPARADTIALTIDFAKVMKLDKPVSTIVIGNPGIADATVEDEQTLVLTGKAAGTTNLIALDQDGHEVANATLQVVSNDRQLTTIFYGSNRQTLSCSPICEKVISVGDAATNFEQASSQIQQRQSFARGR
ncbi:pilus assembly protein N-terminal domain-containing protein [Afifella marina]|uniref:Pilus formation protein N terminal region n=1 Tax=Afifella marina DSM 2698 TaxID=1120955 RepID=A0A1G5NBI9_AFIMA|nr:pilus assembly protein N-terminal domain-containing protein [Afifella marina]SCZ34514.1 Pilus formation protein N terminal region [Afifella marina DSM 2698]